MVPVGTKHAASFPMIAATFSCRAITVGSSPSTSSPTIASAIAFRMAAVGRVTVSERRSITAFGDGMSKGSRRSSVTTASATAQEEVTRHDDNDAPMPTAQPELLLLPKPRSVKFLGEWVELDPEAPAVVTLVQQEGSVSEKYELRI